MKKLMVACFLLFLCLTSCWNDNDDVCENQILAPESLENLYGCVNTPYQMDIDLAEDYLLIQDQETFNNLVTGSCTPQIDFATYNLVIGKKGLTNGLQSIQYSLEENCISNILNLNVLIILNDATEAPNITYHALIPKLEAGESLNVEVVVE